MPRKAILFWFNTVKLFLFEPCKFFRVKSKDKDKIQGPLEKVEMQKGEKNKVTINHPTQ